MQSLNVFACLAMFAASAAHAQAVKLPQGSLALSPIDGDVVSAQSYIVPACPECLGGTLVTSVEVKFTLLGCADQLGPVSYQAVPFEKGDVVVYLSASNVHTQKSTFTDCNRAPTRTVALSLSGEYAASQIRLVSLTPAPVVQILPPPVTCMAYWSGAYFDAEAGVCREDGRSGCSNPFPFGNLAECEAASR